MGKYIIFFIAFGLMAVESIAVRPLEKVFSRHESMRGERGETHISTTFAKKRLFKKKFNDLLSSVVTDAVVKESVSTENRAISAPAKPSKNFSQLSSYSGGYLQGPSCNVVLWTSMPLGVKYKVQLQTVDGSRDKVGTKVYISHDHGYFERPFVITRERLDNAGFLVLPGNLDRQAVALSQELMFEISKSMETIVYRVIQYSPQEILVWNENKMISLYKNQDGEMVFRKSVCAPPETCFDIEAVGNIFRESSGATGLVRCTSRDRDSDYFKVFRFDMTSLECLGEISALRHSKRGDLLVLDKGVLVASPAGISTYAEVEMRLFVPEKCNS